MYQLVLYVVYKKRAVLPTQLKAIRFNQYYLQYHYSLFR